MSFPHTQQKERAEKVKIVLSFIQLIMFVGFMMLLINGTIGWIMLYAITAAYVISIVICFLSRKHYTVKMDGFSGIVKRGTECTANITLEKKGFCLLPFITVEGSYGSKRFKAKASLLFKDTATVVLKLRPEHCGLCRIELLNAYSEDFFGLVRFRIRSYGHSSVAVLPSTVEYLGPEVTPSLLPSESESHEEGITVAFGGTVGYEHREYIPGDTPRRINYKLSAKKKRFMVRLDESAGTESTNIILSDDADGNCAEQALALARRLAIRNSPSVVWYQGESFEAVSFTALEQLREWLAFRDFSDNTGTGLAMPVGSVSVVISSTGFAVRN